MEVNSIVLLRVEKSCLCRNLYCSNLFGIGVGIQASALAPVSLWLAKGQRLDHAGFYRTWSVVISGDDVPGIPISAAESFQLASSCCGISCKQSVLLYVGLSQCSWHISWYCKGPILESNTPEWVLPVLCMQFPWRGWYLFVGSYGEMPLACWLCRKFYWCG